MISRIISKNPTAPKERIAVALGEIRHRFLAKLRREPAAKESGSSSLAERYFDEFLQEASNSLKVCFPEIEIIVE